MTKMTETQIFELTGCRMPCERIEYKVETDGSSAHEITSEKKFDSSVMVLTFTFPSSKIEFRTVY